MRWTRRQKEGCSPGCPKVSAWGLVDSKKGSAVLIWWSLCAVHLCIVLRCHPGDSGGVPVPTAPARGCLKAGQCWRLPGQSGSSLESRHRHREGSQNGRKIRRAAQLWLQNELFKMNCSAMPAHHAAVNETIAMRCHLPFGLGGLECCPLFRQVSSLLFLGRSKCKGWLAISSLTVSAADQTTLSTFMRWKQAGQERYANKLKSF